MRLVPPKDPGSIVHPATYWWFHIGNEIPINCILTKWKWPHIIMDFGSQSWGAHNMGFVNKAAFKNERVDFKKVRQGGQHFYKRLCTYDRLKMDSIKYLYNYTFHVKAFMEYCQSHKTMLWI